MSLETITESDDVEIVELSELSPTVMLIRSLSAVNKMAEWAEETKNGELMGQAAAGYFEIHDRLVELEEDEEHKKEGFGFRSKLGVDNGNA